MENEEINRRKKLTRDDIYNSENGDFESFDKIRNPLSSVIIAMSAIIDKGFTESEILTILESVNTLKKSTNTNMTDMMEYIDNLALEIWKQRSA